ncbi:MarC family protein [Sulfoacidibacillus ferrooxidans]|uniref:MarC family protein n=1 Tax=Sulfoacidibacillus ferrooxidans TaxID=2005001 RepID=UPI001F50F31F|nr:MarC family protein [Sulfoacidibacillus ferrooxidans]
MDPCVIVFLPLRLMWLFFSGVTSDRPYPIFLRLMERHHAIEQLTTACKTVTIAFLIFVMFLLLGHTILHVFGISVAAFCVARGILIYGIAHRLLHPTPTTVPILQVVAGEASIEKEPLSTP